MTGRRTSTVYGVLGQLAVRAIHNNGFRFNGSNQVVYTGARYGGELYLRVSLCAIRRFVGRVETAILRNSFGVCIFAMCRRIVSNLRSRIRRHCHAAVAVLSSYIFCWMRIPLRCDAGATIVFFVPPSLPSSSTSSKGTISRWLFRLRPDVSLVRHAAPDALRVRQIACSAKQVHFKTKRLPIAKAFQRTRHPYSRVSVPYTSDERRGLFRASYFIRF